MQAADLVGRIAPVMKECGEDGLLGHLGVVLYECLGKKGAPRVWWAAVSRATRARTEDADPPPATAQARSTPTCSAPSWAA